MPDNNLLDLQLNGQNVQTKAADLKSFLHQREQQGELQDAYAVAINRNFIPKIQYAETRLNNGDHIEILSPMQGG